MTYSLLHIMMVPIVQSGYSRYDRNDGMTATWNGMQQFSVSLKSWCQFRAGWSGL